MQREETDRMGQMERGHTAEVQPDCMTEAQIGLLQKQVRASCGIPGEVMFGDIFKDLGLKEHLKYGGSMDEVMGAFTEAMKTAGFGEEAEETPKNSGKKTKAATE